jgi:heterodisulfide reductase subunit B2
MKFAYYPGCSSVGTAIEYKESVESTAQYLGIDLEEINNWNCCGASSGHVINHELSLALPSRNLALAEKMALNVVTSCPACFLRLKIAEYELKNDTHLKEKIESYIRMPLMLSQNTKHIIEVLYNDVGVAEIKEKVTKSLAGLKAVVYYGCYLVRPPEVTKLDDSDNPTIMDKIMETLNVEIIDWSSKVDCCGGELSLTTPEITRKLVHNIIKSALDVGADAIITACPLCHANLDTYQLKETGHHAIPLFYFSELTALAFGCSKTKEWFEKHMVNPFPLLERLMLL